MKTKRIGWVIGDQLQRGMFSRLNTKTGGTSLVRYDWLAETVNHGQGHGLRYEIYRPWKKYDALIFLKSMGDKSHALLSRYMDKGRPSVFDVNVNYFENFGEEYYMGMLPAEKQRDEAARMMKEASGVIADSKYLANVCGRIRDNVTWVPDNVRMDLVPSYRPWRRDKDPVVLLWSGEAVKLFELLAIENTLLKYANQIELSIITNSLDAMERWRPGLKQRFENMLGRLRHRIIEYKSIERLFSIYSEGGVVISPRHMDNSYNYGHTEWKITLAMACGRMALCSPVPSYVNVHEYAAGKGIRICGTGEQWDAAMESLIAGDLDMESEERAARDVVERVYSTDVVADKHVSVMSDVLEIER